MEETTGSKLTVQGFGSSVPAAKSDRAGSKSSSSLGCNDAGFRLAPTSDSATSRSSKDNRIATEKVVMLPRFLVIKRSEGDFLKVNPFVVSKILYGLIGEVKSIKKIKDGLLVETVSNKQSEKLLSLVRFGDFDVSVQRHRTLNTSKGLITCPDLLNCTVDEIERSLLDQGVIEVKRIQRKRDNVTFDTANHILTFDKPTLPKYVKAAFYNLPVRPYIPNPMRCFKCQKFGHVADKCINREVCVCGQEPHADAPCADHMVCVNCGGEHSARSRNCPTFQEEMAIQKIKTLERITYIEARKKIVKNNLQKSFSEVTKTNIDPKPNVVNVKNIIQEIIPEIVKICKTILMEEKSFPKPLAPVSSSQPISRSRASSIASTSSKKRSHSSDAPGGESDNSQTSETSKGEKHEKKKKGWKKGRPRKPPKDFEVASFPGDGVS
ncbi:unnamed protein product [Brassicogethes aeneus]|uniref:CCHC-type domain-containing protein n=1 Tax=Brassicogethes aeneus TaxID=1431903 RepID=A0A9P0FIL0_BRAAE|nr:unnamed protein product [Brassicogethes aeneus]